MLSRSFSKSAASTGNRPQNTTDCTSLKPGSALAAPPFTVVMVSPTRGVGHLLDLRGDEADFAGAEFGQLGDLGRHAADAVDQMLRPLLMKRMFMALFQHAVDHADQDDYAQIGIVPAVHQQGLQRRVAVAARAAGCG